MSDQGSLLDFRRGMIGNRLRHVKKLLLVLSGKGGVGKSVIAAAIAAILAEGGLSVGLLDADVYGPSSALLLNADSSPEEGERGLVPPAKHGIKTMSVDLLVPGLPVPLAGTGAKQVVLEMLALTDWGDLDYLVVDMPPATSDIMLTMTSLGKRNLSALVVTMPDRLSVTVAHRVLELLRRGKVPIAGVLGNMYRTGTRRGDSRQDDPRDLAREFGVTFWGRLPYEAEVAAAVNAGDVERLLGTRFAVALRRSVNVYLNPF